MDFVAQSLDNDSPMIVASDRQLYDEGDVRRSQVLEYASMVSGGGEETIITNNVTIYEYKGLFALKVYSGSLDVEGRKAPILCSGRKENQHYWWSLRLYLKTLFGLQLRHIANETQNECAMLVGNKQ